MELDVILDPDTVATPPADKIKLFLHKEDRQLVGGETRTRMLLKCKCDDGTVHVYGELVPVLVSPVVLQPFAGPPAGIDPTGKPIT